MKRGTYEDVEFWEHGMYDCTPKKEPTWPTLLVGLWLCLIGETFITAHRFMPVSFGICVAFLGLLIMQKHRALVLCLAIFLWLIY